MTETTKTLDEKLRKRARKKLETELFAAARPLKEKLRFGNATYVDIGGENFSCTDLISMVTDAITKRRVDKAEQDEIERFLEQPGIIQSEEEASQDSSEKPQMLNRSKRLNDAIALLGGTVSEADSWEDGVDKLIDLATDLKEQFGWIMDDKNRAEAEYEKQVAVISGHSRHIEHLKTDCENWRKQFHKMRERLSIYQMAFEQQFEANNR